MAEFNHTPEPWIYTQDFDENGKRAKVTTIAMCGEFVIGLPSNIEGGNYRDAPFGDSESDASRIVACVNACAGIKTTDLEALRGTSILAKANERFGTVQKQRDDLLEALKKMYRAYVNLLENGRDRISSLGGDCDPVDYMEQVDFNLIECRAAIAKATGSNV